MGSHIIILSSSIFCVLLRIDINALSELYSALHAVTAKSAFDDGGLITRCNLIPEQNCIKSTMALRAIEFCWRIM